MCCAFCTHVVCQCDLDNKVLVFYNVTMYIDIVPNRDSKPAVLLRESYREGDKVKKRTLANLSRLPMDRVERLQRVLRGEHVVPADGVFQVIASHHHGHVQAVRLAMNQLRFEQLIYSRRCRERDLVVAMVAARVIDPDSKLATTRWWHTTTLAQDLGVADAVRMICTRPWTGW